MKTLNLLIIITCLSIYVRVNCSDTDKIDPALNKKLQNGEICKVIVVLNSSSRKTSSDKQIGNIIGTLANPFTAVIDVLKLAGAIFIILWHNYKIIVFYADEKLVLRLVAITIVSKILPNIELPPAIGDSPPPNKVYDDPNWNLNLIQARCSDINCLGNKVVVGIIAASGVQYDHPEIVDAWVGSPYGYFDATSPFSNSLPSDTTDEGTAPISIVLGKTVGVAPNAKWMACKACYDNGTCTQAEVLICAEYIICPWDTTKPPPIDPPTDCPYRPKIVIGKDAPGGTAQLMESQYFWFYKILQKWNDLGIISVFAIGDTGPHCNNGAIPGTYDIACAVGAVDKTGIVTDSSARGPSLLDKAIVANNGISYGTCPMDIEENTECTGAENGESKPCIYIKPDIVAPGQVVPAANIGNEDELYTTVSGTKYAAAHVAGVAALVVCNRTDINWNYKVMYKVLTENAERNVERLKQSNSETQYFADSSHLFCDRLISKNCKSFPSNLYGWGVLNACKAIQAAKKL